MGGGATLYGYTTDDQISQIIDPKNKSTLYRYNGFGDRTQINSPDTGITNHRYNQAGLLIETSNANNITLRINYDALNRPSTQDQF